MATSTAPRRSARLAEMAAAAPVAEAPATPAVPVAPAAPPPKQRIRRSKAGLLEAAQELRSRLSHAHVAEDFAACRELAHQLDDAADNVPSDNGETMFIIDCAWWCGLAKRGSGEHCYALQSIISYIKSLKD